mmetsp:Transcript_20781/g.84564  ORF Transcript_20781/g.84564 Transcript_20781/m.84564 type:complete len:156 (+) Transcript_20781:1033-1500(+)
MLFFLRIVSLNTVFEMLDRRYPVNDVFKSLESHAFTVRGNWIALNPSASVQSETVRAARDVILYMLRESTFLTTAQAKERTYDFLMDSLIEEILEEVCVKVKGTGWKLRLADDNEVIEKYSAALTKHRHEHEDRLHRADELLVEKSGTVKLSTGA